jgi:hypothetical protein
MKYKIQQLSVFLENKTGELADFTRVLSENKVSIKSIILADSSDFGLVRSIVNNPQKAKAVLEDVGFSVRFSEVFGVKIDDYVGSFDKVIATLVKEDVNIYYTYSFYEASTGIFIFSVDDITKAVNSLENAGVQIVETKHFYI